MGDYEGIERDQRVYHEEYGTGTVVALLPTGIQIWWDTPILGTVDTHLLLHQPWWVRTLEAPSES